MITLLKVPFSEKDAAKNLGAKWNPEKKIWYTENVKDLMIFKKWIPELSVEKDIINISTDTIKTFAEWEKIFEEENISTYSIEVLNDRSFLTVGIDYVESNDNSIPWN